MSGVLHNPRAGKTETELKAAREAAERRRRLNGAFASELADRSAATKARLAEMVEAIQCEIKAAAPPVVSEETWEERQARLNPLPVPAEPWFAIVDEMSRVPRRPRIEDIQIAAAKHFRVTRADMISARRTAVVMRPRQCAYYLSKMLTPKSYVEIGRHFGNRDHTSILSGTRKIEWLRRTDEELDADLQAIAAALGAELPALNSAEAQNNHSHDLGSIA